MDKELLSKIREKYSLTSCDLTPQEIEKYKNHELVSPLNLTDEEFNTHFSGIKRMVDEQEACNELIDHCINSSNHHMILVRDEDNELKYKSVYCKKMERIQNVRFFAKNYLYYSFANNYLDLSLTKKYFGVDIEATKKYLIKTLINWIKNPNKYGLYVWGSFGVGKTYTMMAFANDLSRQNKKIAFCFLPELVIKLKQGFDDREINKKNWQIINKFVSADVLILDDIGAEKTTAWFYSEHLMVILDARMQKNKPTFFTSNLSLEQLQRKLVASCGQISGNRVYQRIIGLTNNQSIEVLGNNLRYPKK